MARRDQMNTLTEDMKTSHEKRKATVADIAKDAHETTERFHQEHQKRASDVKNTLEADKKEHEQRTHDLEETLDTSEKERKEQFAAMEVEIRESIGSIGQYVHNLLSGFADENQQTSNIWHGYVKLATKKPEPSKKGKKTDKPEEQESTHHK
jgi:hypothetical protein